MTALRPQRSERYPPRGITSPAGREKAVMMSPACKGVRSMPFYIAGSTGMRRELERTMTKATKAKAAKLTRHARLTVVEPLLADSWRSAPGT